MLKSKITHFIPENIPEVYLLNLKGLMVKFEVRYKCYDGLLILPQMRMGKIVQNNTFLVKS